MENCADKQISRRNFLRWAAISTLAAATPSFGKDTLEEKISKYKIGDETVQLRLLQKPGSIVTYFNMHDNENTAVQAAEEVVKKYGGRLIELKHKGTRNITFNLDGKKYEFDPNRIFTEKGIKETLKKQGNYSEAAFKEVKKLRDWLLQEHSLSKSKAMVTVHNNYNKGFSVEDYKSGVKQKDKDPDDFFIVTNQPHYDHFVNQGYNVALISSKSVEDDGSLSVYWSRVQKRPYINVEAQHGHLEQQVKMMAEAVELYKNSKQKGFIITDVKEKNSKYGANQLQHKIYTVQSGDKTWNIVRDEYGKVNWNIIGKLVEYNKALDNAFNPKSIDQGQIILLPPASALK